MNDSGSVWGVGFVVLAGIGYWAYHRLEPKTRKVWYPRIALVVLLPVGLVCLLYAVGTRSWLVAVLMLAFFAFLFYANVFATRICEQCGALVWPRNLVSAADLCPRCGEELSRSPIFQRRGMTGPSSND